MILIHRYEYILKRDLKKNVQIYVCTEYYLHIFSPLESRYSQRYNFLSGIECLNMYQAAKFAISQHSVQLVDQNALLLAKTKFLSLSFVQAKFFNSCTQVAHIPISNILRGLYSAVFARRTYLTFTIQCMSFRNFDFCHLHKPAQNINVIFGRIKITISCISYVVSLVDISALLLELVH